MKIEFYCGVAIRRHVASGQGWGYEIPPVQLSESRLVMEWWQKRPGNRCMTVWTRLVGWGGDFCQINLWRSPSGKHPTQGETSVPLHCPRGAYLEKWWNERRKSNAAGKAEVMRPCQCTHCLRGFFLYFHRMMAWNWNSRMGIGQGWSLRHHIAQWSHNELIK